MLRSYAYGADGWDHLLNVGNYLLDSAGKERWRGREN